LCPAASRNHAALNSQEKTGQMKPEKTTGDNRFGLKARPYHQ
jgi:hypothetical protein